MLSENKKDGVEK